MIGEDTHEKKHNCDGCKRKRNRQNLPEAGKGLIKNGRAEFVSDCEIRLLQTLLPAVISNITEEQAMSRIIDFNARDFRFDPDTDYSNVGQRVMLSTEAGVTEGFEIGD